MYSPKERDALRNFYHSRGEVFLGPVDHDHVNQVILDLMSHAGTSAVNLVISSPGGETEAGFRLAQFIEQEMLVPVRARVWSGCHLRALVLRNSRCTPASNLRSSPAEYRDCSSI